MTLTRIVYDFFSRKSFSFVNFIVFTIGSNMVSSGSSMKQIVKTKISSVYLYVAFYDYLKVYEASSSDNKNFDELISLLTL